MREGRKGRGEKNGGWTGEQLGGSRCLNTAILFCHLPAVVINEERSDVGGQIVLQILDCIDYSFQRYLPSISTAVTQHKGGHGFVSAADLHL